MAPNEADDPVEPLTHSLTQPVSQAKAESGQAGSATSRRSRPRRKMRLIKHDGKFPRVAPINTCFWVMICWLARYSARSHLSPIRPTLHLAFKVARKQKSMSEMWKATCRTNERLLIGLVCFPSALFLRPCEYEGNAKSDYGRS